MFDRVLNTLLNSTCYTPDKSIFSLLHTLHQKGSFPLRISSVNVTKSVVSCGFGHIYRKKFFMENFIFCVVIQNGANVEKFPVFHEFIDSFLQVKVFSSFVSPKAKPYLGQITDNCGLFWSDSTCFCFCFFWNGADCACFQNCYF